MDDESRQSFEILPNVCSHLRTDDDIPSCPLSKVERKYKSLGVFVRFLSLGSLRPALPFLLKMEVVIRPIVIVPLRAAFMHRAAVLGLIEGVDEH